ncbi:MAG: hypothetical protein HPY66_3410 [Firmicutes bacterium]|nr:hypothetical protein [Bacillota bacterium]
METACNTADGRSIYVKLYSYPLKNYLGKVEGLVLVLEDVSELRKLENQVRRADKLSAVGELASGVAHEIRNPLGIIKAIAQTINGEIKNDDAKEGIGIIVQEVDRANSVIKNLLDFARPNIGNTKVHRLNSIMEDTIRITRKYAEQNRVEMVYEAVGEIFVQADKEKLQQAFVNVILNSVQAMPDGGSLNISVAEDERTAKVSFADNGTGIPPDRLEKVFEPFYTTKDMGTGLGLAITHRIIEEHKGYIEVESTVGKGTVVSIYLPSQPGEVENFEQENSHSG